MVSRKTVSPSVGFSAVAAALAVVAFAGGMLQSGASPASAADAAKSPAFTLVVMDPLAKELACDCVQGYAQRNYHKLGAYLEKSLGCKVNVVFGQALETALNKEESGNVAHLIVGKHSVVEHDALACNVATEPIVRLTGQDGTIDQTGLFVVLNDDPAKTVADLKGYRIFFGPEECDEKSAAPMELLKEAGVAIPAKVETCEACSDSAVKLLELAKDKKPAEVRAAAVISSYAAPLLEGCGTVKKGDLRIIGESKPVPFVTAFVTDKVTPAQRKQVEEALLAVGDDAALLTALETKSGFVPVETDAATEASAAKKK